MLKSENIYLRSVEPSDVEWLYNCENNTEIWDLSTTLKPYTKKTLLDFASSTQDIYEHKQIRFMIISNKSNLPIGTIDLFDYEPFHNRIGVGILIDSNERQKGLGSESLGLCLDYCKKQLQIKGVFCNILEDNKTSISLFEKHGFEITGNKKDWIKTQNGYKNELLLQKIYG